MLDCKIKNKILFNSLSNLWIRFKVGNHDQYRIATRVGRQFINIANVLNLLLGGTAVVYYGEEIGMENLPLEDLKFEDCRDRRAIEMGVGF